MSNVVSETHLPYVAGARSQPTAGAQFAIVNPANGAQFAEAISSDQRQLDDAVAAARDAQGRWTRLSPEERGACLGRWGDLVLREADELAALDTLSMGRPIRDTKREAPSIANRIRYWAGMADKINGRQLPIAPGHLTYTIREPLGIVGVIVPWNGPLGMFVGRTSAALACGNAVIAKPSEVSPLSALRVAELTAEAGLPDGLVNVVLGDGQVGARLAAHPGVNGLQFTGSVDTGRKVAALAASTFKQVVLELGGKAPNLVFADADLDAVARGTLWGAFSNSGQACVATSRLIVERSVADVLLDRLVALARKLEVGDPSDPCVQLGPLASGRQFERVRGYLELACAEARVLTGGSMHGPGFYVDATILTDVDASSRLVQEEIFGPVLVVTPFETEDEALELANGVEFGLSANVWTRDVGRMLRVVEALEAGTIWGNTARLLHPGLPFGGFKDSGLGNASGEGAVEGNTRLKRVSILYSAEGPEF